MTVEEYTEKQDVELEELQKKWKEDAEEALENDALFQAYAKKKDVEVTDEELEQEIERIKSSDKTHHQQHQHEGEFDESVYDNPQWQGYIRNIVQKQKAYQELVKEVLGEDFFEEKKPEPPKPDKKKSKKSKKKKSSKKSKSKKESKKKSEKENKDKKKK
jgi:FKBP-type peptidyl-prolyl cis-trans isomerase (trigger factor)